MGIDFTKMCDGLMARFNACKNEKGCVDVNNLAKGVLPFANATTVNHLTSIFTQAAMMDGNNELSESEFRQVLSGQEFKKVVEEHSSNMCRENLEAKDPSALSGPNELEPGTPRDRVVQEKGEFFAREVWDPMKKLADEALKYMQENNGSLEKFSYTGFPHGVKLLSVAPGISYTNASNDTMSIVDGQPQVTRHADSVQAVVIFEYEGQKYSICSDQSTNNLAPWNNPSWTE